MGFRLQDCLNEIIYSDDCPAELRSILQNVIELDANINAMDYSDYEEYVQSQDFVDDIYALFGVDIVGDEVEE